MKKALILGAAGFVGNYLIDHIQKECIWSIVVTKMENEVIEKSNVKISNLDIMKKEAVSVLLKEERPDYIFHLAAQSSVALSWQNPGMTVDVNIKGSLNVLEVIRNLNYKPRLLLVGSGEEYGHVTPEQIPINEETILHPGNIYAATKACQNMLGSIYARAYSIDVMMVRAFNHIGPGQAPIFVVSDFCKQVAEIEQGIKSPVINVGNLNAKRDFSDVRDVVRSYSLLMENGRSGETYNVGSGKAIAIKDILDKIVSYSKRRIKVEVDRKKLRPVDVPIIEADIVKLTKDTGWTCDITLEQTISDTLEYWRKNI